MQKSWLILPNYSITHIDMGLKIVSGKRIPHKARAILSDELTLSFLTSSGLAAEYFGCICSSDEARDESMMCLDCSQSWRE
jgi:hypothetical protein